MDSFHWTKRWVVGSGLALLIAGGITGCASDAENKTDPDSVQSENTVALQSKALLMAHGYDSDKSTWETYAEYARERGYDVYRYDVPAKDSIEIRARKLAEAILDEQGIEKGSLITVGHSMGGLDLRYLVTEGHRHEGEQDNLFYRAAQKIAIIYAFSTPHKGITPPGVDAATRDMQPSAMQRFNRERPESDQTIDGRKIPTLSVRFKCGEAKISDGSSPQRADSTDGDGVLLTRQQLLNGAPYTQSIFSGKHTGKALCISGSTPELEQTDMLQRLLDDASGEDLIDRDVKDIVFFEDQNCSGDEGGRFSSRYKPDGTVNCATSGECDNDAIRSVMLYPGIPAGTTVGVYSTIGGSQSDDWARIKLTGAITRPVCIESFEHNIQTGNLTLEYHPKDAAVGDENGLDGKISSLEIE